MQPRVNLLSNIFNQRTINQLVRGLLLTLLLVAGYKVALPFIASVVGGFVYTLILIITPAVLYITIRKLVVNVWSYRLPFTSIMLLGILSTLMAGIGIGLIDFIVLNNHLPVFGDLSDEPMSISFWAFIASYISWYLLIGMVTTPLIYGVLWFQLNRKRRK
jgi:hypothetical protein